MVDRLLPEGGANPANLKGVPGTLRVVEGDIGDEKLLAPLMADAEFLFNLAGRTSHADSMSDPLSDLDANVVSQLRLWKRLGARTRQFGSFLPARAKFPSRTNATCAIRFPPLRPSGRAGRLSGLMQK